MHAMAHARCAALNVRNLLILCVASGEPHRRSQDFCLEGATRQTPPSLASVVHTFEAVAGGWER